VNFELKFLLNFLYIWTKIINQEKLERKEKGKERIEINQDEREQIRDEERGKIMKELIKEKYVSYSSHDFCKSLCEELSDYYGGRHRSHPRPHSHRRKKRKESLKRLTLTSYTSTARTM